MLTIGVYIRVKFRAFFYTLAEFEKAYKLSATPLGGFEIKETAVSDMPKPAQKFLDRNGVVLKGWQY